MRYDYMGEKERLRRKNQKIADEGGIAGNDDAVFVAGLFGKLIRFFIVYLPFVMIAFISGRFVHTRFQLEPLISILIAIIAGLIAYFIINKIDFYADNLKINGKKLYLPIKIFVLLFVSGLPFIVGYGFGASFIGEDSPLQKVIIGVIVGIMFAIPPYNRVILSNKSGY